MNIDYTKLNEKIVKQAYMTLDKMQLKQLIQDKIDRAQSALELRQVDSKR